MGLYLLRESIHWYTPQDTNAQDRIEIGNGTKVSLPLLTGMYLELLLD